MDELEIRVAKLERHLKSFRIILAVAVLAICAFSWAASVNRDELIPVKDQSTMHYNSGTQLTEQSVVSNELAAQNR